MKDWNELFKGMMVVTFMAAILLLVIWGVYELSEIYNHKDCIRF